MCNSCETWYIEKYNVAVRAVDRGDAAPRMKAVQLLGDATHEMRRAGIDEYAIEEVKRIVREEC